MAIDDVYTLQLNQNYAAQQIMNTLAFRKKTAGDPATSDFVTLATAFKDMLLPYQSLGLTHTGWIAQQVRGGTVSYSTKPCNRTGGLRYEGLETGATAGTAGAEGLPPQAAVVTTLYTNFSGRARRGRFYMAGLNELVQSNGLITAATVTNLTTAWATKVTVYGLGGSDTLWELGVWSMRTATGCVPNKQPPFQLQPVDSADPIAAFTPISRTAVRQIIYSQRKRTIGVGR